MPKAHPIEVLNKLDRIASHLTGHAVEEPLEGTHDEVGGVSVIMEGTLADIIPATVLSQLDPPGTHQGQEVGLAFQSLNVFFWDTGHNERKKVSNQIALSVFGGFFYQLQAFSTSLVYYSPMLPKKPKEETHLTLLRKRAGLNVRELARQVGTNHTSIMYWERSGRIGKMDFLIPMAEALGVTVEELLGQPRPRKTVTAGGRMGQLFDEASRLTRSQQDKVIAVLEPFVSLHGRES